MPTLSHQITRLIGPLGVTPHLSIIVDDTASINIIVFVLAFVLNHDRLRDRRRRVQRRSIVERVADANAATDDARVVVVVVAAAVVVVVVVADINIIVAKDPSNGATPTVELALTSPRTNPTKDPSSSSSSASFSRRTVAGTLGAPRTVVCVVIIR
eukprot:CAMPEP_0179613584 /NCGR_PEP_ID=MMETSP0930-20121108/5124_1 /TAXON_ID=548131 ORGANISM="Ostreococcus mediterraneus, Strain clade-D-RCC1621" /NCGR_SAMPLE_ID=MMETSP0930 /ASSEMBLY_ACC=CAM_ASM_000580 /LENGTH=155 /DNA_ID=CAMNT_0021482273 /DNA_START=87 /DNA_END=551 /DNA_ORIENTATION=-